MIQGTRANFKNEKEAIDIEIAIQELNMHIKVNIIFPLPLVSSYHVSVFAPVISSALGCFGYGSTVFDAVPKRDEYSRPHDFWKILLNGQKQWWEFKPKHIDNVLFFKLEACCTPRLFTINIASLCYVYYTNN